LATNAVIKPQRNAAQRSKQRFCNRPSASALSAATAQPIKYEPIDMKLIVGCWLLRQRLVVFCLSFINYTNNT